MALFVVLCVFSGLRDFSLSFTNTSDPDLKLESKEGKSFLVTNNELKKLGNSDKIAYFSKTIEDRVLFSYNNKEHVAHIKGVDSTYPQLKLYSEKMYTGDWFASNSKEAVVGSEISRKLSLGLFDFSNILEVYSPKPGKGTINTPDDAFNKTTLQTVGIYSINEEIDNKFVFCNLELAQELLQYKKNQISSIEIILKPNTIEQDAIKEINSIFKNKIIIKNRIQLNDSLYKMLNTENIAVYLIFTLVIIIALFNLIGALIMMILDKKNNLKTLFNIGVTLQDLRKIFLFQGMVLSVLGGIIGLMFGIIIVLLQEEFKLLMITPNLAYPVVFEVKNIIIVFTTISTLGILASWLASRSVGKKLFI